MTGTGSANSCSIAKSASPTAPIPIVRETPPAPTGTLNITWYGHASSLVEIDGAAVLFDPIWSDRCSPSRLFGPRRLHEPPINLDDLPTIDAVVISHDHYDHLDMHTIQALVESQSAPFVVPLGVGSHLEALATCRPTGSSNSTGTTAPRSPA